MKAKYLLKWKGKAIICGLGNEKLYPLQVYLYSELPLTQRENAKALLSKKVSSVKWDLVFLKIYAKGDGTRLKKVIQTTKPTPKKVKQAKEVSPKSKGPNHVSRRISSLGERRRKKT